MIKKRIRAFFISFMAVFGVAGISAAAQNTFTATVYDGVTLSQMESALRTFKINNQNVTIVRRRTQKGNPYVVLTSPGLNQPVSFGGIESSYRGENAGIYAGMLIVNSYDRSQFETLDIDEFNRTAYYAKAFRTPNRLLLRSDHIAAGGTTYAALRNAMFVYLKRRNDLLAASTASTVSFNPSISHLAGRPTAENETSLGISLPQASGESKILSAKRDDQNHNRVIEEIIDAAAN